MRHACKPSIWLGPAVEWAGHQACKLAVSLADVAMMPMCTAPAPLQMHVSAPPPLPPRCFLLVWFPCSTCPSGPTPLCAGPPRPVLPAAGGPDGRQLGALPLGGSQLRIQGSGARQACHAAARTGACMPACCCCCCRCCSSESSSHAAGAVQRSPFYIPPKTESPDSPCSSPRALHPSAAAPAGVPPAAAAAPLRPSGQPGSLSGAPTGGTGRSWQHSRVARALHLFSVSYLHAQVASHAGALPLSCGRRLCGRHAPAGPPLLSCASCGRRLRRAAAAAAPAAAATAVPGGNERGCTYGVQPPRPL